MIASQLGEKNEALRRIKYIKRISPEEFIPDSYLKVSFIYMGTGMKKLGYRYLRSFFNRPIAEKNRFIFLKYIDIDKNFDNVREEDKFQKIIGNKEKKHG